MRARQVLTRKITPCARVSFSLLRIPHAGDLHGPRLGSQASASSGPRDGPGPGNTLMFV
jgi:hypothetical protein